MAEQEYLSMLGRILREPQRATRNGMTHSTFGERLIFDMRDGFPLLTTKRMFSRGIFEELIFFLNGQTNTKLLEDKGVMIWHENTTKEFIASNGKALAEFDIGPMYGFQWRHFGKVSHGNVADANNMADAGLDQLAQVIETLARDPHSRRILMTSYNPAQAEEGVLYPCHGLTIQFYVEGGRISLQMYQRSADAFLGLPFNIASYAALLYVVVELVNNRQASLAQPSQYSPGRVIIVIGDAHIYADHAEAVKEQMSRDPHPFPSFRLKSRIADLRDLEGLQASDFEISDYVCYPPIKAKMVP
jgi:thymidylate synthase